MHPKDDPQAIPFMLNEHYVDELRGMLPGVEVHVMNGPQEKVGENTIAVRSRKLVSTLATTVSTDTMMRVVLEELAAEVLECGDRHVYVYTVTTHPLTNPETLLSTQYIAVRFYSH